MFRKSLALCLLSMAACVAGSTPVSREVEDRPGAPGAGVLDSGKAGEAGVHVGAPDASAQDKVDSSSDTEDASSGFVYKPYDINHVLITGQSNSVANSANPITLTQPYSNLSFDTGVMPMHVCQNSGCKEFQTPSSFIPLVEGDDFFTGGKVETCSSGFANQVSKLLPSHNALVSLHGRSGNTYWCLRKGGCNYQSGIVRPFDQGMLEVSNAKAIAAASGKSYIARAVLAIHGESDHYSYTTGTQEFPLYGSDGTTAKLKDYADALLEWQTDYESSIKGITGQQDRVPLFVSQVSGWNDTKESRLAQMQVDAHSRSNGMVILVTPGYPFPFQSDCLHYTSDGQRRLGAYFAKAYHRVIVEGKRWEPVRPKSITKNGNQLVVKYYVPEPPLVLDTNRISNPGNYGFEFTDDSNTNITQVAATNADTITITLSQPPGTNARLTYAQNQVPKTCIGVQGARGNVRDSDNTPSQYGYEMFNWGVAFTSPL